MLGGDLCTLIRWFVMYHYFNEHVTRAMHGLFLIFFLLFSDFNLQKNKKNNVLNNNQHFSKLLNKLDHDKLFACNIYCFPNLNLVWD
jgi:hypothetical protein